MNPLAIQVLRAPAEQLVTHLHRVTLGAFMPINTFLIVLGVSECLIGGLWLMPGLTKYAIIIFLLHIISTFLLLIILPGETWRQFPVLSLTGQYAFKNIVLIACAFTIYKDCQVTGWNFTRPEFASFSKLLRYTDRLVRTIR